MSDSAEGENVDPDEVRTRLRALADELTDSGAMRSPEWRSAVLAAPRHLFVPRFFRVSCANGASDLVTSSDPDWLEIVYQDESLVTQYNANTDDTTGFPTSSSTAPELMVRMLEALDLHDGHKVLEIGTGTGYNAALLSHRLGSQNVTTVDVDPELTALARRLLATAGFHPDVVTADGADGHVTGAPYDRIIVTCSVRDIPPAWLDQLTVGGAILATIETSLHGYGLARITTDDQHVGHGRILPEPASFMPMRSHANPAFEVLRRAAAPLAGERRSVVHVADLASPAARFVLGLALPNVASFRTSEPSGQGLYLAHHSDGSWAELHPSRTVTHGGHHDLWRDLEAAFESWHDAGTPEPHQFDVTATRQRRTLEYREPSARISMSL